MVVVHAEQRGKALVWFYMLKCASCEQCTLVESELDQTKRVWPASKSYSNDIPDRPRQALIDADGTLAYPSPSIVSSATAVDWMLKIKGLTEGSLGRRIDEAARQHLITDDMRAWAHEVRLGANAERHADLETPAPTVDEARRQLSFAEALAEILFVLPARVTRGRAGQNKPAATSSSDKGAYG